MSSAVFYRIPRSGLTKT